MPRTPFNIKSSQWPYYRLWFIVTVVAECAMLLFHQSLTLIYTAIAAAFLGAALLRWLRIYPGEEEPLFCDLGGAFIACGYAGVAFCLRASHGRFLEIMMSSGILIPHFIYIAREK